MTLSIGDIAKNLKGKYKDEYFLVVNLTQNYAFIADGKNRKVDNLKKKNVKHLKKVNVANLIDFATKINKGEKVGNDKLYKSIKALTENI